MKKVSNMGMFDTVMVRKSFINYLRRNKITDEATIKALDMDDFYQTKDLENLMELYEFKYNGLYHDERKYYTVPKEKRPYGDSDNGLIKMFGSIGHTHIRWVKIDKTMTVTFYAEKYIFEAEMFRGKITGLKMSEWKQKKVHYNEDNDLSVEQIEEEINADLKFKASLEQGLKEVRDRHENG